MDCLFVGQHIIELSSIDSTNNYLIDLSQNISLDEGTVVVAKEQTAGKGQRNNRWSSEVGKSLCISILLKPKLDISQQYLFNKFIALSLCQALNNYSLKTKIKWPNDILIDGKKVAGILIENSIQGSKIEKSVVGIGVNINNNISQLTSATSLADCLNIIPSISELLELICKNIEKNYFLLRQKPSIINELYHQNLFQIGEVQKFSKNGESLNGIIHSVNKNGQLLVEVNGRLQFYNMGEIKFMI
tara:strand:+ start:2128 stop:2862 length:735 start_codon:yes stop_codon:yes gene_type:complete